VNLDLRAPGGSSEWDEMARRTGVRALRAVSCGDVAFEVADRGALAMLVPSESAATSSVRKGPPYFTPHGLSNNAEGDEFA